MLFSGDGESDSLFCGSGPKDAAFVDRDRRLDEVLDCEIVLNDTVGELSLTPSRLLARPGRTASLILAWRLDQVVLRLQHRGRTIGRVTLDQETRRLTASGRGVQLIANRSTVTIGQAGGKRVTARLALRSAAATPAEPSRRPSPLPTTAAHGKPSRAPGACASSNGATARSKPVGPTAWQGGVEAVERELTGPERAAPRAALRRILDGRTHG